MEEEPALLLIARFFTTKKRVGVLLRVREAFERRVQGMAEKDGRVPPRPRVVRVRGGVARAARFDKSLFAVASARLPPSRRARKGGGI